MFYEIKVSSLVLGQVIRTTKTVSRYELETLLTRNSDDVEILSIK